MKRKIIKIDEKKCTGCAACITGCPEQAIQIVDTKQGPKARLVKDFYCDGLGACLGTCPEGAISIEEREAQEYDDKATVERIKMVAPEMLETHIKHLEAHGMGGSGKHEHKKHEIICGCPSAQTMDLKKKLNLKAEITNTQAFQSELVNWPVQMHLVSPSATYFKNADIAIVADCVPFAYASAHQDFFKGRVVIIGCPKLDDTDTYTEKVTDIITQASPKSITVVHMEVPCCSGLDYLVQEAIKKSDKKVPYKKIVITIKGGISAQ
ncbi:MAG: hypothetical protein A2252_09850 [Elusimicrobia bacterium RIFOXYA2_FULL_39_19]|nr:MAG: hypothetical protein A2252_09850 [Elusimicrobia bacterium RIFOXYA2_FULL_39_19]